MKKQLFIAFFALSFFICNVFAGEEKLDLAQANLVQLNLLYKQKTGHFMENGCLDKKWEFPFEKLTFSGEDPSKVRRIFFLIESLFKSCEIEAYNSARERGDVPSLPELVIKPEDFEHHIFAIFVRKYFTDSLPFQKHKIFTYYNDSTGQTENCSIPFFDVESSLKANEDTFNLANKERWERMGFAPTPNHSHTQDISPLVLCITNEAYVRQHTLQDGTNSKPGSSTKGAKQNCNLF
jgi:hypothetical protein